MILSARAGGVGLTLMRANHVIHLSRWWNPAVEDQCTGRVLRIGQERPVTVHIPLAVLSSGGSSFDQNLQALLERKRELMRAALIPTEETIGEQREVLEACLSA
jgi:SNF2 family DNA or RNA helicase